MLIILLSKPQFDFDIGLWFCKVLLLGSREKTLSKSKRKYFYLLIYSFYINNLYDSSNKNVYTLVGKTFNHNFLGLVDSYTKSEVPVAAFILDKRLN